MYEEIQHEIMEMPQIDFPVKIHLHHRESSNPPCQLHWHEQLEFYYVKSGGLEIMCNAHKEWIYQGDIAFINWCDFHRSLQFLDNTSHYIIQVDLEFLSSVVSGICEEKYIKGFISNTNKFAKFLKNDTVVRSLFDKIIDEYFAQSYGYEFVIRGYFCEVLTHIIRNYYNNRIENCNSYDYSFLHIKKALVYLSSHYSNHITLNSLASYMGVSSSHLCRIFKKYTGLTVTNYINQLRCYSSIPLILNGTPITEIAFKVGYNDSNYYSRIFKKVMGVSPRQFSKKYSQQHMLLSNIEMSNFYMDKNIRNTD